MKELNTIQTKLNAPKSQYNSFGKYKYRSCEDILAAVKPLLKETGCQLTISDDIVLVGERYYIKATATLINAEGEVIQTTAFAREDDTLGNMSASQRTGSCSSYARKYALNGLFAIDDTKDADALNVSPDYASETINECKKALKAVQSRSELNAVWQKYGSLASQSEEIMTLFTNTGKKFPKTA